MRKFELTVLFFICFSAPAFASVITLVEIADLLDEGVKVMDGIIKIQSSMTIYGAPTIIQVRTLKGKFEGFSKILRSGEATKEEAEKTLKCIKDAIGQVKLVEGTEQGLINIATSKVFPLVDKAEKSINAL